ncbi:MAG: precorrin-3B C(17)-methyltransferase [Oscillospiraceae bacterium]|nr:precorrin-3B C(17)-methyltransferase [Oscillospiraceae bacterium]
MVGIGPGDYDNITIRADRALRDCSVIIGYTVYVELVRSRYRDKTYLTTAMTREAERCRIALDEAKKQDTAFICSGDSGIYGMAALVYELRGEASEPEIEVIPGLTAACSGGALLGAPLTHDFAVISLSDRLTDWDIITKRLKSAASADLSIVLYNPASRGRPEHLRRACDILLDALPPERLCGVVKNIGREGQERYMLSLAQLRDYPADMFCTVFIGNSASRVVGDAFVTPRGYRDV